MQPVRPDPRRWMWLAVAAFVLAAIAVVVLPWVADRATEASGSAPTTTSSTTASTTSVADPETTSSATTTTATQPSTTSSAPEATSTTTTTVPVDSFDVENLVDSGDSDFDLAIVEAARWIEAERGLGFLRPVTVVLMEDEPFVAELEADLEEDREELNDTEGILLALGLIEPGVKLYETFSDLLGAGVVGFYDPETDRMVLRTSSGLTESTKATLVHELVHALEDQWFELERPELEDDPEALYAFQMLAEGSARYTENQYISSLSSAQRRDLIAEQVAFSNDVDFSAFPQYLLDVTFAPYEIGPGFVSRVLVEFGVEGLNDAFRDAPVTTEQILFFDKFRRREPPIPVNAPGADGEVFDEGSLGQFDFLLLLQNELAAVEASTAAEGWGGDRFVAWTEGNATCVRFTMVGDTERDTREIADSLIRWADRHGSGASVVSSDGIPTVTSCQV